MPAAAKLFGGVQPYVSSACAETLETLIAPAQMTAAISFLNIVFLYPYMFNVISIIIGQHKAIFISTFGL